MFTASQISAIRTAYRFAGLLPVETGADFIRTIHRAWKVDDVAGVVSAMHGIAFEVSNVEGAMPRLPEISAAIACFD